MASEPLEAARRLVGESDQQGFGVVASQGEVRLLRDAVRALIDHGERLEKRLAFVERRIGVSR